MDTNEPSNEVDLILTVQQLFDTVKNEHLAKNEQLSPEQIWLEVDTRLHVLAAGLNELKMRELKNEIEHVKTEEERMRLIRMINPGGPPSPKEPQVK
jgi:hypothetical protein